MSRSIYLANSIRTFSCVIKTQDSHIWRILACSFSAQLLTMDLWGHRLYSWIFARTLQDAAKWFIANEKSPFESLDHFIDQTNRGGLEVGMARHMVLSYQQYLTEQAENLAAA